MTLNVLVLSDDPAFRDAADTLPDDTRVVGCSADEPWPELDYGLALLGPDVVQPVQVCQRLCRRCQPQIILVVPTEHSTAILAELRLVPQVDLRSRVVTVDRIATLPAELSLAALTLRGQPKPSLKVPTLTDEERENLQLYFQLYDAENAHFQQLVGEAAADVPEMLAVLSNLPPDLDGERRARSMALHRKAVMDGDWAPYCDDLRGQGILYARMGLPLRAWFDFLGHIRRRFLKEFTRRLSHDPERVIRMVLGFEHMIDIAMEVVCDAYLAARDEISSSEEARARFLSALSESAEDAILACSVPRGRIVYANPAAERLYGYAEGTLAGLPVDTLSIDDGAALARYEELSTSGEVLRWDTSRRRADGDTVEVAVTASRIVSGSGEVLGVLDVARDISQRLQAQRELLQRQQALERSNADLEQFAYVSSHDLKEPLRMVSAYGQLLQRTQSERLDERGQMFLQQVLDGAARMRRLLEDLLEYSRIVRDGPRQESVELSAVVNDAVADLQLMAAETHARIQVDPLPRVQGDRTLLRQVFQNLIANAIKFRNEEPPAVTVSAEREGERAWRIKVSDNGIGIDPEHRDRVFVIFQRLHERDRYEGSGIGLAIVKKIVNAHGGRIWVEPRAEGGSVFQLTLPGAD